MSSDRTMLNFRIYLGVVLLLVGFAIWELGVLTVLDPGNPINILTQSAAADAKGRSLVVLGLQFGGGVVAIVGLITAISSLSSSSRSRMVYLTQHLLSNVDQKLSSVETNVNSTLGSMTRRIDNSYKLLDEKVGGVEGLVKSKGLANPDTVGSVCKYCNAEIPPDTTFCAACGRAQK
ncbi:MAG: zinc ribbon domain-containing protein [Candidatus Bathyarchaeia archaeon]